MLMPSLSAVRRYTEYCRSVRHSLIGGKSRWDRKQCSLSRLTRTANVSGGLASVLHHSMNLRLLQLGDSALPIGGYSHSWGLEAAVQRGGVRDAATLERWLASWLEYN